MGLQRDQRLPVHGPLARGQMPHVRAARRAAGELTCREHDARAAGSWRARGSRARAWRSCTCRQTPSPAGNTDTRIRCSSASSISGTRLSHALMSCLSVALAHARRPRWSSFQEANLQGCAGGHARTGIVHTCSVTPRLRHMPRPRLRLDLRLRLRPCLGLRPRLRLRRRLRLRLRLRLSPRLRLAAPGHAQLRLRP